MLNVQKLFGENARLAAFKDNLKGTQIDNHNDYEKEMKGKDNLDVKERKFIKKEIRRKQEDAVEEERTQKEEQRYKLKQLQDYLYSKYQFETLKPNTCNKTQRLNN
jgi:hypothetical protein